MQKKITFRVTLFSETEVAAEQDEVADILADILADGIQDGALEKVLPDYIGHTVSATGTMIYLKED